jgi:DnaA-homolog protein
LAQTLNLAQALDYYQPDLGILHNHRVSFANFLITPSNQEAVNACQDLIQTPAMLWLYGAMPCGKTHILHALCQTFSAENKTALYVPLATIQNYAPHLWVPEQAVDLVCIDGIQVIAGQPEAEALVFSLYNHAFDHHYALVIASTEHRADKFSLPDLASRLAQMRQLSIESPDVMAVFNHRAEKEGIVVSKAANIYIRDHYSRNLHDVMTLLDNVRASTVAYQQKLTVPLLKHILASL